jgi:hypothetical protein
MCNSLLISYFHQTPSTSSRLFSVTHHGFGHVMEKSGPSLSTAQSLSSTRPVSVVTKCPRRSSGGALPRFHPQGATGVVGAGKVSSIGLGCSECGVRNDKEKYPWESPQADLAEGRRLIYKHGYLRRKEELEDAEQALGG